MSSQLGRRREAICFQLLFEENKAGEVQRSEPEGGVDKQRPAAWRIIPPRVPQRATQSC